MYPVSLRFQRTYSLNDTKEKIEGIFQESWAGYHALRRGDSILLKPNCLSAKPPEAAVTTHPTILEATIQLLLDHGCRVAIGDSPALQKLQNVAKKAGIMPVAEHYSARLQSFNDPVEIKGPENGIFRTFEISRHCLEYDHFINLAKFKTHTMMVLTLCVKNLFGCVPGKKKAAWHLSIGEDRGLFARMLVELASVLPVDFHLLDGIVAMEGNGPGNGTPTTLGVLMGGENAAAVDMIAARLIGMKPSDLPTCRAASKIGAGPTHWEEIAVLGDPLPSSPLPFKLPSPTRTDWGLPGILKATLSRFLLPFPYVEKNRCKVCLQCQEVCPPGAISLKNGEISIATAKCIRCYCCQEVCPEDAISFKRRLIR